MARPLAQRLLIKRGERLLVMNAPDGHLDRLRPLPDGVIIDTEPEPGVGYDGVHLFAQDKATVDNSAPIALGALRDGGLLWVAYPKKSGPIRSDITRDHGWQTLGSAGWDAITQVAIDDTWSTLRFKPVEAINYTKGSTRRRAGQEPPSPNN